MLFADLVPWSGSWQSRQQGLCRASHWLRPPGAFRLGDFALGPSALANPSRGQRTPYEALALYGGKEPRTILNSFFRLPWDASELRPLGVASLLIEAEQNPPASLHVYCILTILQSRAAGNCRSSCNLHRFACRQLGQRSRQLTAELRHCESPRESKGATESPWPCRKSATGLHFSLQLRRTTLSSAGARGRTAPSSRHRCSAVRQSTGPSFQLLHR